MKSTTLQRDSSPWRWPVAKAALAVALIALCGPGFADKGGIPGPPTGGETGNSLSVPGIQTQSDILTAPFWSVNEEEPELGVQYSYGCDAEEPYEAFNYPNTSCVDELMNPTLYYTAEQCVAVGNPCEDFEADDLFRIYWQKQPLNQWSATDDGKLNQFIPVAYVDWGDALEAVSWNERSVIRVETQPWASTIEGFDPTVNYCAEVAADPENDCKVGFQMWHVSGQGITEHWGVRATDLDAAVSYNFDSPFQIIKTMNARLNIAKMEMDSATCSQPGGNPGDDPPVRDQWVVGEDPPYWVGTCRVYDAPYTVETSVGGKYVYGYNLRMKAILPSLECGDGWEKTGFYRLTFYAPDDVDFTGHSEATPIPNVAPPAVPSEERTLPRSVFNTALAPAPDPVVEAEEEEEEGDDRLYRPVIDAGNNLTYLDICIVAKPQGGGGGGGGKGGGGRGGGTGGGKGSGTGGGGGNH